MKEVSIQSKGCIGRNVHPNQGPFTNDVCKNLELEPTLLLDEADVLEVPLAVGLRAAEAARAPRLPHRGDERPPEMIKILITF